MLLILAFVLGGLGIFAILTKTDFLGILIGTHLGVMGLSVALVYGGLTRQDAALAQGLGVLILISTLVQIIAGFAFTRFSFCLHGTTSFHSVEDEDKLERKSMRHE